MNPTKRQHTVPEFLLAEFTPTRDKENGVLHVFDMDTGRSWESTPNGVSVENEFYTANFGSGLDPRGIETAFSTLEANWGPLVHDLNSGVPLPDPADESLASFFQFVGMQATRTPDARRAFLELDDDAWQREFDLQTQELDEWATIGDCVTDYHRWALEERKKSASIRKSEMQHKKQWVIEQLIWAGIVMPMHFSHGRKWSVWGFPPDGEVFAGCDRLVTIFTLEPLKVGWPCYRDPNSIVLLPIGSHMALVGLKDLFIPFDDPPRDVARVNLTTALNSRRVFAAKKDFHILMPDESIGVFPDWLDFWVKRWKDQRA